MGRDNRMQGATTADIERHAMLAVSSLVARHLPAKDDPTPDDLAPHARLKSAVRRLRAQQLPWSEVLARMQTLPDAP